MKKLIALIIILSLSLSLFSCMPNLKKFAVSFANTKAQLSESELRGEEYGEFLSALEKFGAKLGVSLYGERGNGANFCISPVAVYMQLALACECSEGETREEILSALGLTYEQVERFTKYLYSVCNREFTYVDEDDKRKVIASEVLSSSLWLDDSLPYASSKIGTLTSAYGSDVYAASFSGGDAAKMINQYLEYKTDGIFGGSTKYAKTERLAFVSAFSLSELWNGLGKNLTSTLETYDFVESDGTVLKLQMLRSGYADGRALETESFSSFFVETEHGFKLHFIVPRDGYQLKNVFTASNISRVLSVDDYGYLDSEGGMLHHTRVIFPAFEAKFNGDLSSVLGKSFGIESLFDSQGCDLSGISSSGAYCGSLMHSVSLKIDKSGIGGAEPVALTPSPSQSGPDYYEDVYHELMVDRAFGFVLTDSYGTVLYSGVISNFE